MSMSRYGFSEADWERTKGEMRRILIGVAGTPDEFVSYSELVPQVSTITFDPRDPRLWDMLREISSEENAAGRGMLTAVVTHARGDMMPGQGFFELARALGHNPSDEIAFWLEQVRIVREMWSGTRCDG